MNNKGADQTAQMRIQIWAFVVCIWHKQVFSWCGSIVGSEMTRLWLLCILCLTLCLCEAKRSQHEAETDDNDFAEFEDFDDEEGEWFEVVRSFII